jgi:hypothetical protein
MNEHDQKVAACADRIAGSLGVTREMIGLLVPELDALRQLAAHEACRAHMSGLFSAVASLRRQAAILVAACARLERESNPRPEEN